VPEHPQQHPDPPSCITNSKLPLKFITIITHLQLQQQLALQPQSVVVSEVAASEALLPLVWLWVLVKKSLTRQSEELWEVAAVATAKPQFSRLPFNRLPPWCRLPQFNTLNPLMISSSRFNRTPAPASTRLSWPAWSRMPTALMLASSTWTSSCSARRTPDSPFESDQHQKSIVYMPIKEAVIINDFFFLYTWLRPIVSNLHPTKHWPLITFYVINFYLRSQSTISSCSLIFLWLKPQFISIDNLIYVIHRFIHIIDILSVIISSKL